MQYDRSSFRRAAAFFAVVASLFSGTGPAQADDKQAAETAAGIDRERMVIDFADGGVGSGIPWRAVNDGVMGGLSEGGFRRTDAGTLEFSGVLSLENNGGFSSIRTGSDDDATHDFSLNGFDGILLRVRGDGRTYDLRLNSDARTANGWEVSFKGRFATRLDEWIEVKIPFDSFVPTFHGRVLDGISLDPAMIRRIGFLLGDKKAGPFRLEVGWIKAYRNAGAE